MPIIVRRKQTKKRCPDISHDGIHGGDAPVPSIQYDGNGSDKMNSLKTKDIIIEEVDSAIRSVNKGIQKILSHRQCIAGGHDIDSEVHYQLQQRLLPHIRHCLIELQQQLNALQIGLYCFQSKLLPIIHDSIQSYIGAIVRTITQPLSNKNHRKTLMHQNRQNIIHAIQHLFYWLLHLHDGYIFTVSGECRHSIDQNRAKQTNFKSQLNQRKNSQPIVNERKQKNNGTSESSAQLYSTERIYSGTSWDEYMDSKNGLRTRFLQSIMQLKYGTNASGYNTEKLEAFWEDWTYEMTQPGYLLEIIITHIETQMLYIQSQFTSLSTQLFTKTLQNAFKLSNYTIHTTISLNWFDKMESLRVVSSIFSDTDDQQKQILQFERYADDFQIHTMMKSGILPLHFRTEHHWWHDGGMKFDIAASHPPNLASTKRRRVIVEMDEDSTSDQACNKIEAETHDSFDMAATRSSKPSLISGGLVVKMIDQKQSDSLSFSKKTIHDDNNCSVNDIKMQFGIDVQDREAAYDVLQAEEDVASREAYIIDHTATADIQDCSDENGIQGIYDEIQQAEKRIKDAKRMFRRILENAMHMSLDSQSSFELDSMDVDIWNAREVFREALMHGGDVLLWSVDRISEDRVDSNPKLSSMRVLCKSIRYFSNARDLVLNQQKLHNRMNSTLITSKSLNDDIYASICFFRRNLLLLLGQAQVNIGIGHIELARQCYPKERDPIRKEEFHIACDELSAAIRISRTMQSQALDDMSTVASRNESILLDRLKAQQLELLALRWKASTLWFLFKNTESFHTFQQAAAIVDDSLIAFTWMNLRQSKSSLSPEDQNVMIDAVVELRLEIYHCWTTLADFASQSLERATLTSICESIQQRKSFYNTLFDYVERGLENAAKVSQVLCNELHQSMLSGRYDELCNQDHLLKSETLLQSLKDIREWWSRRRIIAKELPRKLLNEVLIDKSIIPRNDLFSNGKEEWEALPTQRFVLQPYARRSKYSLGGTASRTAKLGNNFHKIDTIITPELQVFDRPNLQQAQHNKQRFRKWREDMIPDPMTGIMMPNLVYPSIAPPIPPHIQSIVARKRGTLTTYELHPGSKSSS